MITVFLNMFVPLKSTLVNKVPMPFEGGECASSSFLPLISDADKPTISLKMAVVDIFCRFHCRMALCEYSYLLHAGQLKLKIN